MPLKAMVTPLSLYMLDETIFDGMQLPTAPVNPTEYPDLYIEGFNLDRQVLIDTILMDCGELECIYPEPDFFKYAVASWSRKELHVWQALYDTLFYKYNPLWNKDGTIKETARDLTSRDTEGTRTRTGASEQTVTDSISETDTHNLTDQRTANLTTTLDDDIIDNTVGSSDQTSHDEESKDTTNHTAGYSDKRNTGTVGDSGTSSSSTTHGGNLQTTTQGTTENQVSAYNESAYQNRDKTTTNTTQTETDSRTELTQGTSGNTRTDNLREEAENDQWTTDSMSGDSDGTVHTEHEEDYTRSLDSTRRETGTDTMSHTGTLGRTGTNRRTTEGNDSDGEETSGSESGSLDHTLTRTEQGNIGVTMTTQLIEAQRELVQLNFYDLIADRFKERFCLLVY